MSSEVRRNCLRNPMLTEEPDFDLSNEALDEVPWDEPPRTPVLQRLEQ